MAKEASNKVEKETTRKPRAKKVEVKDMKSVSQSTAVVMFKCSKDQGGMKAGQEYRVSENIAEILEARGLGEKK
jgi:hypothetical protein